MICRQLGMAGLWLAVVVSGGCRNGLNKHVKADAAPVEADASPAEAVDVDPDRLSVAFVDAMPDLATLQVEDVRPDAAPVEADAARANAVDVGPDRSRVALVDAMPDLPALRANECPLTAADGGELPITQSTIEARLPSGPCPIAGHCEYAAYLESTCSDGSRGLQLWDWSCACVGISWHCAGSSVLSSCPRGPVVDGGA
jgi:hypothetical protein